MLVFSPSRYVLATLYSSFVGKCPLITSTTQARFDVFNALTLLDNPLFLKQQLFGPGDGYLHYYLFNYRTADIMSGVNSKNEADDKYMGGVGVVML